MPARIMLYCSGSRHAQTRRRIMELGFAVFCIIVALVTLVLAVALYFKRHPDADTLDMEQGHRRDWREGWDK